MSERRICNGAVTYLEAQRASFRKREPCIAYTTAKGRKEVLRLAFDVFEDGVQDGFCLLKFFRRNGRQTSVPDAVKVFRIDANENPVELIKPIGHAYRLEWTGDYIISAQNTKYVRIGPQKQSHVHIYEAAARLYDDEVDGSCEPLPPFRGGKSGLGQDGAPSGPDTAVWDAGSTSGATEAAAEGYVAELEDEVVDLGKRLADREREAAELRAEVAKLKHEGAGRTEERTATVAALTQAHLSELHALRQEHGDALATLTRQHEGVLAAREREYGDALGALKRQQEDALAARERAHEDAVGALKREQESALGALRREHENALAARGREHADGLAELRRQHELELDALRKEHEREAGELKEQQGREVEAIREEHGREVEAIRGEHGRAVAALQQEYERARAARGQEHGDAVAALRQEHERSLATLREEHKRALAAVRKERDAAREEVRQLEMQCLGCCTCICFPFLHRQLLRLRGRHRAAVQPI